MIHESSTILENTSEVNDSENWTEIIRPKSRFFNLNLDELWRYRDLIILFVVEGLLELEAHPPK